MDDQSASESAKTDDKAVEPTGKVELDKNQVEKIENDDDDDDDDDNDAPVEKDRGDQEWMGVDIVESLCMRCGEDGETRFKIHKIPFFKSVVLASFSCDFCGEANNEVTFGGEIMLQGVSYTLKILQKRDLDRQLIKSDSASVTIPHLEFEIPPGTQKGEISTIEGFLKTAAKNLAMFQEDRFQQMPEVAEKVQVIIDNLNRLAEGDCVGGGDAGSSPLVHPFTITVRDPAGNSFIENPSAPSADPNMKISHFNRTPEEDMSLGLDPTKGVYKDDSESNFKALALSERGFGEKPKTVEESSSSSNDNNGGSCDGSSNSVNNNSNSSSNAQGAGGGGRAEEEAAAVVEAWLGHNEVISIPGNCPNCNAMGNAMTAITKIPHFKEVIIMAFDCSECGFRNNEVKAGGAVPSLGTQVTLTVTNEDDLKRDILKSDSAAVTIPELELELGHGTLGGQYTTVEGLLKNIRKGLDGIGGNQSSDPANKDGRGVGLGMVMGDSMTNNHTENQEIIRQKQKFAMLSATLDAYSKGRELPFKLIIRDPLGNSFVSAPLGSFLPPEMDFNLKMEDFERSYDENEEFGLNDMNTTDFEVVPEDVVVEISNSSNSNENSRYHGDRPASVSDRITEQPNRKKLVDHPTAFAKGTLVNDDTKGGLEHLSSTPSSAAASTASSGEGDGYWTGPKGWVFARPDDKGIASVWPEGNADVAVDSSSCSSSSSSSSNESRVETPHSNARVFDPVDLTDQLFEVSEEFRGPRKGKVFRLGAQGVGYYTDKRAL